MVNRELEALREYLNKLVNSNNTNLHEGEILDISQKLDKLINDYYEVKGMHALKV